MHLNLRRNCNELDANWNCNELELTDPKGETKGEGGQGSSGATIEGREMNKKRRKREHGDLT
jgi:hypothetical protein